MGQALAIVLAAAMLLQASAAFAELLVVVNPKNPVDRLSRTQVVDLYMGRRSKFPDGRAAFTIDLAPESPLRVAFYESLVEQTVPQINAYWARQLFTGRATPPRVLPDLDSVLEAVGENRDAIGYTDGEHLDDRVKVIFRLEGARGSGWQGE